MVNKLDEIQGDVLANKWDIPEPTAQRAVPGVSPGARVLIPSGYLHPGKRKH
jgi:hypothetical protein